MNQSSPIHIIYSTFSGTSQTFAQTLFSDLNGLGIPTSLQNIGDLPPPELLSKDNFVFIVSTHYEGNTPDDANNFYDYMVNKDIEKGFLKGKMATVFGLGDNTYENFNKFSRDLIKFLKDWGVEFYFKEEFGSDDEGEIESYFTPWKKNLLGFLEKNYVNRIKKGDKKETSVDRYIISKTKIELKMTDVPQAALNINTERQLNAKTASIKSIIELRQKATEFSTTKGVEIEIGQTFRTADNIILFTRNTEAKVSQIFGYFKLSGEEFVYYNQKYEGKAESHCFPNGITARELLECFVDLNGPLKNSQIKKIGKFDTKFDQNLIEKGKQSMYSIVDFVTSNVFSLTFPQFLDVCAALAVH